jgi:hypothetical protein
LNAHDTRRIPFTLPAPDPSLMESLWAGIRRVMDRDSARNYQRQAVRVSNKALRDAQIRRINRQPGLSPAQRQLAIARILGGEK